MDIAVIGASGAVGRAVCAQILATGLLHAEERLQLVGRRGGASETGVFGLRIDLLDAYAVRAPQVEPILDAEAINADVIIMVAGATPPHDANEGTTRDAVARTNRPVFEDYARAIARYGRGHEVVIIQSNPVELAVDMFARHLERHRVMGAGSYNDTLRFRREIASGIPDGNHTAVTGYVLGEHGPNLVPIWSSLGAPGVPAEVWQDYLYAARGRRKLEDLPGEVAAARDTLQSLIAGGEGETAFAFVALLPPDVRAVVKPWFAHWSGGTSTVTAHSAVDIVRSMRDGHRVMLPLQVAVTEDDWPGVESVLGLPVDVDIRGWHRTMAIHLAIDERKALEVAAAAVNERLEAWQSKTTMGATA